MTKEQNEQQQEQQEKLKQEQASTVVSGDDNNSVGSTTPRRILRNRIRRVSRKELFSKTRDNEDTPTTEDNTKNKGAEEDDVEPKCTRAAAAKNHLTSPKGKQKLITNKNNNDDEDDDDDAESDDSGSSTSSTSSTNDNNNNGDEAVPKKRKPKRRARLTLKKPSESLKKKAQSQGASTSTTEAPMRVGDLVWAHVQGYPWWPSKVFRISSNGEKFLVYFFGANEKDRWAWIKKHQYRKFDLQEAEATEKQTKNKSLKSAIQDAKAEWRRKVANALTDGENEDTCFECGLGGVLILCDGCPNACHFECTNPRIYSVPDGAWYCSQCVKNSKSNAIPSDLRAPPPAPASNGEDEEMIDSLPTAEEIPFELQVLHNKTFVRPTDPAGRILKRDYWSILEDTSEQFQIYTRRHAYEQRKRNGAKVYAADDYSEIQKKQSDGDILSEQTDPELESLMNEVRTRRTMVALKAATSMKNVAPVAPMTSSSGSNSKGKSVCTHHEIPRKKTIASLLPLPSDVAASLAAPSTAAAVSNASTAPLFTQVLLRYKYYNEDDTDYRLVKIEIDPNNNNINNHHLQYIRGVGYVLSGAYLRHRLGEDKVALSQIAKLRYFDSNDQMWHELHDHHQFPLQLVPTNDDGSEHHHHHQHRHHDHQGQGQSQMRAVIRLLLSRHQDEEDVVGSVSRLSASSLEPGNSRRRRRRGNNNNGIGSDKRRRTSSPSPPPVVLLAPTSSVRGIWVK